LWNVTKTLVFLAGFWFVFLFILPIGVSIAEIELGIQRFPPQMQLATVMLAGFTLLGLWAALTLAVAGDGTPAPFDTARKFVVGGPFAYIRNPFMVAAIGQGVAVGIALGSIPVIVYVSFALIVWYFVVRPAEERDLDARFGKEWRAYAAAVKSARPRLTPYRPARVAGSK
jgi:protein-S-isoprenylcysteine O-methyltransferase Ste14